MYTSLPSSQDPQLDDAVHIQADSAALDPPQPVTMPVLPPIHQSTEQQQEHLIRELGTLNARIDELMREQPSMERVYQQQLATAFPDLPRPINPNHIFYSRYREDAEGHRHLLSCEPLGSLLNRMRAPDADTYLTAERGAYYREPNTLDADKSLSSTCSAVTLASVLEVAFTVSLNEFWGDQENAQPSTEQQLIALRRQVLAHQLALQTVDETVSAAGRTLADSVLKYPTAAAREQVFPAHQRPGVYRLALEDGSGFAAAFIMNATGGTPPAGNVMLYTAGEGFEEYENLGRLNETVAARVRDAEAGKLLTASLPATAHTVLTEPPVLAAHPLAIDVDVIADSVRSLRIRQHFNTRATLRMETLPVTGELDSAADLTAQLDASLALAARNLHLVELREPDWLKMASPIDQAQYRQLETAMIDSNNALLPRLETISTLESFSTRETDRVLKMQHPAYASVGIAPYRSLVHLRVRSSQPINVTGYRNERTGTVFITEDPRIDIPQFLDGERLTAGSWETQVVVDLRTLASYARRNVDPWSLHDVHRTITATADIVDTSGVEHGRLDNADLRALARQADIGKNYGVYLKSAFSKSGAGSAFASAWQRANAAKMQKDALESLLNPTAYSLFIFKTPGSGLDWIRAVVEHPDSTTRPPVGRFDIDVNLLVLDSGLAGGQGGQVINGVAVIQRRGTRPDGVSVLYTPDAPDGMPFRELVTGLTELDALKQKTEWQTYFTLRMATNDAEALARIFSDVRSVHRYTLTPITGHFQDYMYSAHLGFQLSHADYRSRSNAEVARESAVNAFMFGVEAADFLTNLLPSKTALAFLRRGVIGGLRKAQQLGRSVPGLVKKIARNHTISIAIGNTSIRPLEPAWINVAAYRLPTPIDLLFDVEAFAQASHYKLSRATGAPSFTDAYNNQLIAIKHEGGRYHLYPSYVEDGARYVKDPAGNKVDFMVVPGDAKSWKPRFERTTAGAGPVLSRLLPRTAEQQVDDNLLAALRIYASAEEVQYFTDALQELTGLQKQQLLDNALQQLNVDMASFLRMLSGQRGLNQTTKTKLRNTLLGLRTDADIFIHINRSTDFVELSHQEKIKLHIKIQRIMGKNDNFSKFIRGSIRIVDPETRAQLVGYAISLKHLENMDKFDRKFNISTWTSRSLDAFLSIKGRQQTLSKIASDHNVTREAALEQLLSAPGVQAALADFRTTTFIEELRKLGVASFSEAFKKSGVPYIALSQGIQTGTGAGVKMVDSVSVTAFEKNLSRFSEPLEFTRPRVQTHKIEKPSLSPGTPAVPAPTGTRDPVINTVQLDELAEAQIPLLPNSAITKLEEIIHDIQAGRISRKKLGRYTYVDLPQVEAGSGRGKWRAAFEHTGKEDEKDIFILRGIIDYHGSKLKAWGI